MLEINTKTYFFGNKQITLSADSVIEIRNATNTEKKIFEKSHWNFPQEVPFQFELWNELCSTINNLQGTFLGEKHEVCSEFLSELGHDKFEVPGADSVSLSSCTLELTQYDEFVEEYHSLSDFYSNLGYVLQFKQKYIASTKVFTGGGGIVNDPYRVEKQEYNTSGFCNYPHDFSVLIDVLENCIKRNTQPRKSMFSKKLKEPKISEDVRNIQTCFKKHKIQIDRFKSEATFREKILNQAEYKQFNKKEHRVLQVNNDIFFEHYCGFDIDEKYSEIKKIITKISNSNDLGENKVDYAIKWFLAETSNMIVAIERNCESKYRYGCIMLSKPDFIDEPQEYDHILVSSAGIILIETKHWKGKIAIRPDGKWVRDVDNDGRMVGAESPAFQMLRHETLIKNILPNVPVFSLLCFSNGSAILEGQENFTNYPVVYADQLKDTLLSIIQTTGKSKNHIDYITQEIERYKVNIINN